MLIKSEYCKLKTESNAEAKVMVLAAKCNVWLSFECFFTPLIDAVSE